MRAVAMPKCYMCGMEGTRLYDSLQDRYFDAPGLWTLRKCPNRDCGLVWLDPEPTAEDIGKAYKNYYTHSDELETITGGGLKKRLIRKAKAGYLALRYGYGNNGVSSFSKVLGLTAYLIPPRRANADFSVMYLPCLPGGHLLEVGCGNGSTLRAMQELGWKVEGVDFDPAAIEICRRKRLKVHLGTLEDVKYPDKCFDAVIMSHLIEHVHDPLEVLSECYRILKPTGRLSLVTPNVGSLGHRFFGRSWFHLDPPRHLHIFTQMSLKKLARKAGFQKIKLFTTIRDANSVFIASRSISRTSRYKMGSVHSTIPSALGRAIQVMEWALLKLDHGVGEELALVLEK